MSKETILRTLPDNEIWRLTDSNDFCEIADKLSRLLVAEADAIAEKEPYATTTIRELRVAAYQIALLSCDICDVLEARYGLDHSVWEV